MTRNQIEIIKAKEIERADRAKEELEARSQNLSLGQNIATNILRGLTTALMPKKTITRTLLPHVTVNNYQRGNRRRESKKEGTV